MAELTANQQVFRARPLTLSLTRQQQLVLAFFAVAIVMILRRPDHLRHPAVWDEDGTFALPDFIAHGWRTVAWPLFAYLDVPSRFITAVAATISFDHYAAVALVLSLLAGSACVVALAWAPTVLPLPMVCAFLTVLAPTSPEVVMTPIDVCWWTGLLLFPALLWRNDAAQAPRLAFIALAGLSSPLVLSEAILFVFRAALDRTRGNIAAAATVLGFSALQYAYIHPGVITAPAISPATVVAAVSKFFGLPLRAVIADVPALFACGLVLIAVLALGIFTLPKQERRYYLLLGFALAISAAAATTRASVLVMNPFIDGPRYFFYPAALTMWMLLWLMARSNRRSLGTVAGVLLVGMLLLLGKVFAMHNDKLPWQPQAEACAAAPGAYTMIIQYNGHRDTVWTQDFDGPACRAAQAKQLF